LASFPHILLTKRSHRGRQTPRLGLALQKAEKAAINADTSPPDQPGLSVPKRPCDSSSIPAAKKSVLLLPA
jgi:hypothetical protein